MPHLDSCVSSFQEELERFKLILIEGVQVKTLQLWFALGLIVFGLFLYLYPDDPDFS